MENLTLDTIKSAFEQLQAMKPVEPMPTLRQHPALPYETMYAACDVADRREVRIPSGEFVHALRIDGTYLVSDTVMEHLKSLPSFDLSQFAGQPAHIGIEAPRFTPYLEEMMNDKGALNSFFYAPQYQFQLY